MGAVAALHRLQGPLSVPVGQGIAGMGRGPLFLRSQCATHNAVFALSTLRFSFVASSNNGLIDSQLSQRQWLLASRGLSATQIDPCQK